MFQFTRVTLSHNLEQPKKEQVYVEDASHTWTCIPVSDFDVPSPPASDVPRGVALRLLKSLKEIFNQPKEKAANERPQWDRPSDELLRSISPDPDWKHAATQLGEAVGDEWFENRQPARLINAFVAAPGINIAESLQHLARHKRLTVIPPPSPDSLFEKSRTDAATLESIDAPSTEIAVIPHLEWWYLRHEDGLGLVRNLLERISCIACEFS